MRRKLVASIVAAACVVLLVLSFEFYEEEEHHEVYVEPARDIMIPTLDSTAGWLALTNVERELMSVGAVLTKEFHVPLHHHLFREGIEFEAGGDGGEAEMEAEWTSDAVRDEEYYDGDDDEAESTTSEPLLYDLEEEGEDDGEYDDDEDLEEVEEELEELEEELEDIDELEMYGALTDEERQELEKERLKIEKKALKAEKKAAKKAKKKAKKAAKKLKKAAKQWRNDHLLEFRQEGLNSTTRRTTLEYLTKRLSKLWNIPLQPWDNVESVYLATTANTTHCPSLPDVMSIHRFYEHPEYRGKATVVFKGFSEDLDDPHSTANSDLFLPRSPKKSPERVFEHEVHSCYHKWSKKTIVHHVPFLTTFSVCKDVNTALPGALRSQEAKTEAAMATINLSTNSTYWYHLINEGHSKWTRFRSTISIPYATYDGAVFGTEMPLHSVKHSMRIWSTNDGTDPWMKKEVKRFSNKWAKIVRKLDAHEPCYEKMHLQDDDD